MNNDKYRPGVGIMLINKEGKVFVGQRIDDEFNTWQMPQGGIEKDENLHETVFRELLEEIGTNDVRIITETEEWLQYELPDNIKRLDIWDSQYIGQKQKWFLVLFTGEEYEININTENPEFKVWRWQNIGDLVDNVVYFKREMYTKIVNEFMSILLDITNN